jgi:hypothetical protein
LHDKGGWLSGALASEQNPSASSNPNLFSLFTNYSISTFYPSHYVGIIAMRIGMERTYLLIAIHGLPVHHLLLIAASSPASLGGRKNRRKSGHRKAWSE